MTKHVPLFLLIAPLGMKHPAAARLTQHLLKPFALAFVWATAFFIVGGTVQAVLFDNVLGQDSHAYWLAAQSELDYSRAPGERDAYLYSPLFLTAIRPIALLPWPLFLIIWFCIEAGVLFWLLRPLHIKWAAPLFLISLPELAVGNIYLLLAGAAVLGMRQPVAWSFPILTKLTVGIGLAWFAVRGEWLRFLQGLGGLALIVGVSYAFEPGAWQAWLHFLLDNREGTPDSQISFYIRCSIAALLVVVGARKQWPSLIAPAMILASPVLMGLAPYTLLAAAPRLARLSTRKVTDPDVGGAAQQPAASRPAEVAPVGSR